MSSEGAPTLPIGDAAAPISPAYGSATPPLGNMPVSPPYGSATPPLGNMPVSPPYGSATSTAKQY